MRNRFRLAMLALASIAALALAAVASAGYTSPKLTVSYAPKNVTRIAASSAVADDATARVAIVLPAGTTVAYAAPGSTIGKVKAQVSALALGGALLPLTGQVLVAPPGAVAAAIQTPCIGAVVPSLTLLLALEAAGQKLQVPAYLVPTSGASAALGSTQLVFCLPPPDIPTAMGGATFGAKFLGADLTISGLFSPVSSGAWVTLWTPWKPAVGQVNAAGSVASPTAVAAGAVTATVAKSGSSVTVAGSVTQGGKPVAAQVQVFALDGGPKLRKTVAVAADGAFSVTIGSKATAFRVEAIVAATANAGICAAKFSALPIPCVNATVSGFRASTEVLQVS